MRKQLLTLSILLIIGNLYAQEEKSDFKPSGKPFIKVFTNFHSKIIEDEAHNAFQIQRTYLGYAFKLHKKVSGKVTLDVADPVDGGKLKMTAFLKNAYLQYKGDKLTTKFGLIGLNQWNIQEKHWGGRYLYKSFQDQHKFGHSADLAVYVDYKIHDIISVDATIANGDGYKSLESDSLLKYSAGLTLSPFDGFKVRAYYDFMGNDKLSQQTLSFYLGYGIDNFKIGAEYNHQLDHKITDGEDMSGMSFYTSYKINKIRLFGRYDYLTSVTLSGETDPWNYGKDGSGIIAGIEINPIKGIKITPNYQAWIHSNNDPTVHYAYLSLEIKF